MTALGRESTGPSQRSGVSQALLEEIVRRVVEVAKPDRIILFGSSARGTMGPDSDLDLLVIKANVPHRRRLAQQIYLSLFGIPVPVDVVVVTPDDIRAYGDKIGTIIGPALQEGRELYAASAARSDRPIGMAPSRPK